MSFYECNVHSLPEGSDSPSRLALVARHLGYNGIIICNHTGFENIFVPEAAQKVKGIKVTFGAEVVANNPKVLHSRVSALRVKCPFIAVHGGSEDTNRAACEDPNVDVLLHPEGTRQNLGIAAARAAELNQVAIGFDLSPLIRLRGSFRSKWLEVLKRNIDLARKFDISLVITTGARSHLDLRAPRDLIALAELAGFEPSEASEALSLPARILELNNRKWSGLGVELV